MKLLLKTTLRAFICLQLGLSLSAAVTIIANNYNFWLWYGLSLPIGLALFYRSYELIPDKKRKISKQITLDGWLK